MSRPGAEQSEQCHMGPAVPSSPPSVLLLPPGCCCWHASVIILFNRPALLVLVCWCGSSAVSVAISRQISIHVPPPQWPRPQAPAGVPVHLSRPAEGRHTAQGEMEMSPSERCPSAPLHTTPAVTVTSGSGVTSLLEINTRTAAPACSCWCRYNTDTEQGRVCCHSK